MPVSFAPTGPLPRPFDEARAERTLAALAEGPHGFSPSKEHRPLLESAFGNSPYLARLALREREFLKHALERDPGAVLTEMLQAAAAAEPGNSDASAMTVLRRAKNHAALVIALADIAGIWDVPRVTRALSVFADAAIGGALRFLLRRAAAQAEFPGSAQELEDST